MSIDLEKMDGNQMDNKPTEPEDLGIKIGTELEAKWTETRDKAKKAIMVDAMNIEISEAIIKIAEKHIAEEQKNC